MGLDDLGTTPEEQGELADARPLYERALAYLVPSIPVQREASTTSLVCFELRATSQVRGSSAQPRGQFRPHEPFTSPFGPCQNPFFGPSNRVRQSFFTGFEKRGEKNFQNQQLTLGMGIV
jgi:hypothetical protein